MGKQEAVNNIGKKSEKLGKEEINMKKLFALLAASAMMMGATGTVLAAENDKTKDIDTTDTESTQDGEIWATLSETPLSQLKVTLPIRIDFAVIKTDTGQNTFQSGDYNIIVDKSSEIGVKLTKIQVNNAVNGKWTLDTAAKVTSETTDPRVVSLSIAGTDLVYGANTVKDEFKVGVGLNKSLGVKGTASAGKTGIPTKALAEKAFDVTYTIEQAAD